MNFLICRIHHEFYVIPLDYVSEVIQMVALHDVPDKKVLGMATVRDKVIPIIEPHHYLDTPPLSVAMETPIVVLTIDERMMGFVVDDVDRVITIDSSDTPKSDNIIQRVFNIDANVLFEINFDHILGLV